MPTNPCPQPYPQSVLPPIVDTGKYLAVFDINGILQVLSIPVNRSLLSWDGSNITFLDGSQTKPIIVDKLEQALGGSHPYLLIQRPSGQLMAFTTPATMTGKSRLISDGGQIMFEQVAEAENEMPSEGVGLIGLDKNNDVIVVGSITAEGLYYIDGTGVVTLIKSGTAGQVLSIVNNAPSFADPTSGAASGGFPGTGLRSVLGANSSTTAINIQTSTMVFKSSVDGTTTTIDGVNVNVAINAPVPGPGGIDVGAVANNSWYYVWLINNGVATAGILSLSAIAPDISNAPGYTLSAFASMIFVDGTGVIRPFIQKGVDFRIAPKEYGNAMSITNAWTPVPGGTAPLAALIPPNAVAVSGQSGGSTTETQYIEVSVASDGNGIGEQFVSLANTASLGTPVVAYSGFKYDHGSFYDLMLPHAPAIPQIYWKANQNHTAKRRMTITGFKIRG